jgi:NAD(P)-dependent dehydrogenase (short-subunit alcohol dehydrogenase family)
MDPLRIEGRAALITGGAAGIGLATARRLHARGARVAIADIDVAAAETAASELGSQRAIAVGCDVAEEASVAAAVARTVEAYGGLDVVVANAGITQPIRPLSVVDPAAFDRVLAVNLDGVVHTVRQALPHVIERCGHVLVIASVYAFVNGVLQSSYAMSKAAVEQLGRALRVELAPQGASAGVGYFGFVDTGLVRGAFEDPLAERARSSFPGFLAKQIAPEEAAAALVEGIERRAARTIRPRRWIALSFLRGLFGPALDRAAASNAGLGATIGEAESADRGQDRRPV